jgi:hypothetical protein
VEGVRLDDSPDTRANLLAVLQRHPELVGVHRTDGRGAVTIDISPDGKLAAVGTGWGDITLYDTSTWEEVGSFDDVPPWDVCSTRVASSWSWPATPRRPASRT